MTMNRLITSIVQLFLLTSVVFLWRMMWQDLKEDFREIVADFKK